MSDTPATSPPTTASTAGSLNSVFKTAESRPETPGVQESRPPDSVTLETGPVPKTTNIPLDKYYAENDNNPYASQFFALDTPFNYLPVKVQDQLKTIDKFVDTELADRGWKHSTQAFEQVLSDVLVDLGDSDGNTIDQIERLSGYAKNIIKLDGLDDVRKQIKHKMRRMQSAKDMGDLVLKEIGKKIL